MPRSILQQDFGPLEGRVFQLDVALDPKASCVSGEVRDRDAIVEDVVNPAHALRSGFNIEGRVEKPLILAVARSFIRCSPKRTGAL